MAYVEQRIILAKLFWTFEMELQDDSQGWGVDQRITHIREHRDMNVKLEPFVQ